MIKLVSALTVVLRPGFPTSMRPRGDEGEVMGGRRIGEAVRLEELRRLMSDARQVEGVGIDIEAVSRFHQPALSLFTPTEVEFCLSQPNPAEAFAGRWCAKEAVVKAVSGRRTLSLRDVEIRAKPNGAPDAWVRAEESWVRESVVLSISHAADVAIAIAIVATTPKGTS